MLNLFVTYNHKDTGEAEESMGDRARRMGGGGGGASLGLEAPKADSVAVLLQQGLQVI
jgi:hypothetical protein